MFVKVIALLTLLTAVAVGQGVSSAIAPTAGVPAGCSGTYGGQFEITVAKVEGATKRDLNPIAKRGDCATNGNLVVTLENGILKDAQARTGYIAANYQFQFDQPPQTGSIFTAGFSACGNGSLALGGSAVFYECASGDFFNLYDRSWAAQCSPVEILIMECGTASQAGDGQVVGTQIVTTTIVSALSDGQPQVKTMTTGIPVCQVSQIADGQVQVGTTPCASITTTPVATPNLPPVSQQSDGQIQVTPPASVPTVSNAPAPPAVTPPVPAGSAPAPAPAPSGGSVVPPVPLPSAPESTLATTATTATTGGGASATTPATSPATSAPATNGGATFKAASMGALFVGVIGAVAFL
ncbi:hypothetical protein Daus18300_009375 [Diaporthe australafricana]|uniref:Cell wall mannoprotein PIR1-like C-terminal domain-containing protein n=1 Tax=Diaporthe australafricana TaxID=127596 RepID=A0ABR3WEM2_9PEZI